MHPYLDCPVCQQPTDDCECVWHCQDCGNELHIDHVEDGFTICPACAAAE